MSNVGNNNKKTATATCNSKEDVNNFLDAMFAAAGDIKPGEMISFSMQPASAGNETGRVQLTSPDTEFEQWVNSYCKEESFEEDDPDLCAHCNKAPCIWDQEVDNIAAFTDPMMESGVPHRQIRFQVYQYMTHKEYGFLGKGNRRELPKCVVDEIHDTWPQSDGKYTGFREASSEK